MRSPHRNRPARRRVLAVALGVLAALSHADALRAGGGLPNALAWKPGDGWELTLVEPAADGNPRSYPVRVAVTAVQRLRDHDCWRVEMIPPADLGIGVRVLVDPDTGLVPALFPRDKFIEKKVATPAGLPLANAPPSWPIEVLPFFKPGVFRSTDSAWRLSVTADRAPEATVWQAQLFQGDREVLLVRQKWRDGEKWWDEYERYAEGQLRLSGRRAARTVTPYPYPLRLDSRLAARVPLRNSTPEVKDLLHALSQATGLTVTLDPALESHNADYGVLQSGKQGLRAWQVMELMEREQLLDGRWAKTETGYTLSGRSTAHGKSPRVVHLGQANVPEGTATRYVLIGAVVMAPLVAVCALIYVARRRTGRKPEAA